MIIKIIQVEGWACGFAGSDTISSSVFSGAKGAAHCVPTHSPLWIFGKGMSQTAYSLGIRAPPVLPSPSSGRLAGPVGSCIA